MTKATHGREIQMEKYRNALEAKNSETDKLMETFKAQIVKLKKGLTFYSSTLIFIHQNLESDNSGDQILAKDKLIDSYKTQADMMKRLISRHGFSQ